MLAHAIDNPAPSTVMIITGDRDFAYAMSILRLRSYRVILITLANAHPSLTAQASFWFDWVTEILDPSAIPTVFNKQARSDFNANERNALSERTLQNKTHETPLTFRKNQEAPGQSPAKRSHVDLGQLQLSVAQRKVAWVATSANPVEPPPAEQGQFRHRRTSVSRVPFQNPANSQPPLNPQNTHSFLSPTPLQFQSMRNQLVLDGSSKIDEENQREMPLGSETRPSLEKGLSSKSAQYSTASTSTIDSPAPSKLSKALQTSLVPSPVAAEKSLPQDVAPEDDYASYTYCEPLSVRPSSAPSAMSEFPFQYQEEDPLPVDAASRTGEISQPVSKPTVPVSPRGVPLSGGVALSTQNSDATPLADFGSGAKLLGIASTPSADPKDPPAPVVRSEEGWGAVSPVVSAMAPGAKLSDETAPSSSTNSRDLTTGSFQFGEVATSSTTSASVTFGAKPLEKTVSSSSTTSKGAISTIAQGNGGEVKVSPKIDIAPPLKPANSPPSASTLNAAAPPFLPTTVSQPVVPEIFKILVDSLHKHLSKGVSRPLRSVIALEVANKGITYKKAGVKLFKHYAALAQEQGIIELGGREAAAWISLAPKWRMQ
ncbi:hypothetical protein CPC08DRAFT_491220 [Agrocybe pediades]|nr:hypothetical protein CPC08DRAFT_491220 [Agrocybe pediades]